METNDRDSFRPSGAPLTDEALATIKARYKNYASNHHASSFLDKDVPTLIYALEEARAKNERLDALWAETTTNLMHRDDELAEAWAKLAAVEAEIRECEDFARVSDELAAAYQRQGRDDLGSMSQTRATSYRVVAASFRDALSAPSPRRMHDERMGRR